MTAIDEYYSASKRANTIEQRRMFLKAEYFSIMGVTEETKVHHSTNNMYPQTIGVDLFPKGWVLSFPPPLPFPPLLLFYIPPFPPPSNP